MIVGVIFLAILCVLMVCAIIISVSQPKEDSINKPVQNQNTNNDTYFTAGQILFAVFIVLVGIVFSIYSMPVILLAALIFKLSNTKGGYITAFFKATKILCIIYLVILLAFGLCMAMIFR